jgi:NADH-quinone oxidoreductase subunit M
MRDPVRAFAWGLAFTAAAFASTVLASAGFYLCLSYGWNADWDFLGHVTGRQPLAIDELSAPLMPVVGLLHFLSALATGRTQMRQFSVGWSLAYLALRLSVFGCRDPWLLIGLLALGTIPAYLELLRCRRPTQVYVLHMALFVALLVLAWAQIDPAKSHEAQTAWATVPLLAAILIRTGTAPAHCWLTDWFEHASFGIALLFVTPLTGAYAAVRLVLPVAPDWVLRSIGLASLATAVYASAMAVVQLEARRFLAYLLLSHSSLVLVGLELHTATSLTGALALWISVALSLTGFGLTLRALEARFGRLTLSRYHGLYEHSPALAVCFLVTGLASVGFPGTLGFVASEMLIDGAVGADLRVGVAIALAAALNGIAVLRAYFLLFTGARHVSTVSLAIGWRERFAVLTLTALLIGGGLFPQPGISSRFRAAEQILRLRGDPATGVRNQLTRAQPLTAN